MQESGTPTHSTNRRTTAILIVDVQQDFCAGGALAVPGGDQVVPVLNPLLARASAVGLTCYATRDWHPSHSNHFRPRGPWPVHCVAGTPGARFHHALRLPAGTIIVNKGVRPDSDGYSAFDPALDDHTDLTFDAARRSITHFVATGLATDYCVRASVLDALRRGFEVTVLADAIAAVDSAPGDGQRALEEMRAAGAVIAATVDVPLG
jgi:nicotinamidase/pyrazinamidase